MDGSEQNQLEQVLLERRPGHVACERNREQNRFSSSQDDSQNQEHVDVLYNLVSFYTSYSSRTFSFFLFLAFS